MNQKLKDTRQNNKSTEELKIELKKLDNETNKLKIELNYIDAKLELIDKLDREMQGQPDSLF